MQFKIPQNVQIEDKIVGPLTFKQLIIMGIGGGLAYVTYLFLAKRYFLEIWLPPVAIIVLFTLAFAFVRPLTVSFLQYILLWLEYSLNPRKRVWIKGAGDVRPSLFTQVTEVKKSKNPLQDKVKSKKFKSIHDISEAVDTHTI